VETVPALVVASYRDDELDRAHPLRILLGELARSRTVTRLKPARLSPGAVTQLAEPYEVDADELYRKTAGNPFFVVEALATKAEGIPDTVRDAVLARAARLSPDGGRLLEAVAVVPPKAELWLLEALAGDAVDGLDECLTSGMLVAQAAGVAFRHELARLAVEEWVPPHRGVELHRRALAALADPPGGAPDLPGWSTMPRPLAMSTRFCTSHRRPPPGRRRLAPTVRRPHSTAALSGSAIGCRSACGRSCSRAAPRPAT
jgi:hypothetical protein